MSKWWIFFFCILLVIFQSYSTSIEIAQQVLFNNSLRCCSCIIRSCTVNVNSRFSLECWPVFCNLSACGRALWSISSKVDIFHFNNILDNHIFRICTAVGNSIQFSVFCCFSKYGIAHIRLHFKRSCFKHEFYHLVSFIILIVLSCSYRPVTYLIFGIFGGGIFIECIDMMPLLFAQCFQVSIVLEVINLCTHELVFSLVRPTCTTVASQICFHFLFCYIIILNISRNFTCNNQQFNPCSCNQLVVVSFVCQLSQYNRRLTDSALVYTAIILCMENTIFQSHIIFLRSIVHLIFHCFKCQFICIGIIGIIEEFMLRTGNITSCNQSLQINTLLRNRIIINNILYQMIVVSSRLIVYSNLCFLSFGSS